MGKHSNTNMWKSGEDRPTKRQMPSGSPCRIICQFYFRSITFEILRTEKKSTVAMIARAEGITDLIFFFVLENQVVGDREKCTPKSGKISPKLCHFGQTIDFIAKFCQHWKKKGGWAKTRAMVSRPLIWNPKVWSPYRNETKWHPRLAFLPISRSNLINFLLGNILNLTNYETCRFPP